MNTDPYDIREFGVVELRRYLLKPGQRDVLIELFDREFIEPQRDAGMPVIGGFRDDDHPNTFTWLRGFADMESRRKALMAFYGGPVWAAHRNEANATMLDSDNVLLLTPVPIASGGNVDGQAPRTHIVTFHLARAATADEAAELGRHLGSASGDTLAMLLVTLDAVNDFPALPVRQGEHVLVAVLTRVADHAIQSDWCSAAALLGDIVKSIEVFNLCPTRSARAA